MVLLQQAVSVQEGFRLLLYVCFLERRVFVGRSAVYYRLLLRVWESNLEVFCDFSVSVVQNAQMLRPSR
jgi:hypothetical protein